MIKSNPQKQNIIIFDGVCNFCNNGVNFIIKRDKHAKFLFSPMQSNIAQDIMAKYDFDQTNLNTILLIKDGKCFSKSDAVIEITKELSAFWYIFSYFKVFPLFIRDYIYDVVSKNRYKLFGKKSSCIMPTKGLEDRFLV